MKAMRTRSVIGLCILPTLLLAGCLNLKPKEDLTRYFVLSAPKVLAALPNLPAKEIGVGVGPVLIPTFYKNTLAVRTHANELRYMENYHWSERLDRGVQRVVAFNLSRLLNSDTIIVNEWQRETVQYELQLGFILMECDESGEVVVESAWQIFKPGGEKPILAEVSRFEREGPSLRTHPESSVSLISEGLLSLSREIAEKIRDLALAAQPVSGASP